MAGCAKPELAFVTATPSVSVVVPTWNGAVYLPGCLDGLAAQTYPRVEVIVVDGASTDDTRRLLESDYPAVAANAVWLPCNRGFAFAANAGIRASGSEVVALLNNDTEPTPGWLESLVRGLLEDDSIGMATSKVRLLGDRERLHTTGDVLRPSGDVENRGAWEVDRGQFDAERDVFGANAAAAAYRRSMLDEVGLFEEAFGSYYEDVDLAWRARLVGWRCAYVPDAVVYHAVSATGGGAYASYRVARNRLWTIVRNYPARPLARNYRAVVASQRDHALRALRAWRGREARATLLGLMVGLITAPLMLPSRWRIQASRRASDAEVKSWFQRSGPSDY